ncbi:MAG: GGDEF and EAL domain-containing protein [Lachnospiraceae bacterium]|nr:GGDEF and EAL domain-containing protein [Lachnospiraceae bacterium]MBQ9123810.1 GGDEF and EAL domain-containing protein [Lachnospiraceae bacterium]
MDELRYQLNLLKAMNQKLSGHEHMYRLICDSLGDAFLYCSLEKGEINVVGKLEAIDSYTFRDLKDLNILCDVVAEEFSLPLRALLFLEKEDEERRSLDCKMKDDKTWLRFEAVVYYNKNGEPADKVIKIEDITKNMLRAEEMRYLAFYDPATGLFNRNYFVSRLNEFLLKAEQENDVVSVIFIDIDGFKNINDGFGLLIGDEIVQQIGQYLNEFSSDKCLVSHLYTDVFCIAVYDPTKDRSIDFVTSTINKRFADGFVLSNGERFTFTASMGVAEYPEAATSSIDLLNCAEIVMFKAKENGRGAGMVQYFDAAILQDFLKKAEIENKLKDAVFRKNFEMYFQPQYFSDNERLRGVEALIRWKSDGGKMVSPSVFIPIAEKNGLIMEIGTWVLSETLSIFKKWKDKYNYPMIMSVNISAMQYKQDRFVNELLDLLHKYDIKPEELELEITETLFIEDIEEVKEKLHILRDYGVRISLDDFGTGFSSLAYLQGLPIDTLKIDKSFIDNVGQEGSGRIITESIIQLVERLGYETVAEGVETAEQYAYLKEAGCDIIQGYLLGKPMPEHEIDKLLIRLL